MVVLTPAQTKKEFGARLKRALIDVGDLGPERGLPQRVAAHYKRAFTYQAVQKWLNGTAIPESVHIAMICTDLRISIDWLFTGEGQMLIAARERGRWPFKFDQGRFDTLTRGQKIAIEGVLEGQITDFESTRPRPTRTANGRRESP